MTSERRFEQDLPALLAEVGLGPRPDYRDDIVRQTATLRQRPAWTLPERWLPVSVVSSRVASPPRVPLRLIAVAALLIIALVGVLLFVGARSHVPPPFGPAANGLIAYSKNGDIYTVEATTGTATAVVTGSDQDANPAFSRDGTKMVFVRADPTSPTSDARLVVASVDGSDSVVITPDAVSQPSNYSFSPDGSEIAFISGARSDATLWIARADGRQPPRQVHLDLVPQQPTWLPPGGHELLFSSVTADGVANGIYAVNVETGGVRPIVKPADGVGVGVGVASPDGSRIAYSANSFAVTDRNSYVVHVVRVDGAHDVPLPMPSGAVFQDAPAWSNDSRQLAVVRGYAPRNEAMAVAVLPADGTGVGVGIETEHGIAGCCDNFLEWAPDDTSILFLPDPNNSSGDQVLIDPTSGMLIPATWLATSPPTWQRVMRN
jgi:hypothetical protein